MNHNCKIRHRTMRLFVLSSGYVAVIVNAVDTEYWGGIVIPLGFGSEVSAHEAVNRIQRCNPENTVVFAGGLAEYKQFVCA